MRTSILAILSTALLFNMSAAHALTPLDSLSCSGSLIVKQENGFSANCDGGLFFDGNLESDVQITFQATDFITLGENSVLIAPNINIDSSNITVNGVLDARSGGAAAGDVIVDTSYWSRHHYNSSLQNSAVTLSSTSDFVVIDYVVPPPLYWKPTMILPASSNITLNHSTSFVLVAADQSAEGISLVPEPSTRYLFFAGLLPLVHIARKRSS